MGEVLTEQHRAFLEANHPGHDPDELDEGRAAMVAEQRLVYALTPERVHPSSR